MRQIFEKKSIEINFILFPIWILPTYLTLKFLFSSPEIPFLIFLILFGETHFASTFLFFFSKNNHNYINKNRLTLIFIPIFLVVSYFIFGIKYFEYAVLLGAIASGIHVTRQSIGISRLYATKRNNIFENLIYISSFSFLFIGFLRFYFDDLSAFIYQYIPLVELLLQPVLKIIDNKLILALILICLSLFAVSENTDYKKKLVNLTGVLLYSPYLFMNNVYDAMIIGVGAHWSQYLFINYKIYFYKQIMDKTKVYQIIFISVYALIMGLIGFQYHFSENIIQILILIPLSGQFFHYIIDAFIWRFSVKELRENIGSKLFAN